MKLVYHGIIYSKKNSKCIVRNKKTGKMSIVSNKAAKANEIAMASWFAEQVKQPITNPCTIHIKIFEPNFMRRDLDNQSTSIIDALIASGIIADDDFKHIPAFSIEFGGVDKLDPRAEITIKEVENGSEIQAERY